MGNERRGVASGVARLALVWAFVGAFAACADGDDVAGPDAGASAGLRDSDGDGLCDVFERSSGTDPQSGDTDQDGVPDPIEVGYGFDPSQPDVPGTARIAYLEARRGAVVDVPIRVTVDGDGEDYTGAFETEPSLYDDGREADAFFAGAYASAAEPSENARGLQEETFVSVLGRTRLEIMLRFEHPDDPPAACVRAFPFRYRIKSSQGTTTSAPLRLLVVAPSGAASSDDWCVTETCGPG